MQSPTAPLGYVTSLQWSLCYGRLI